MLSLLVWGFFLLSVSLIWHECCVDLIVTQQKLWLLPCTQNISWRGNRQRFSSICVCSFCMNSTHCSSTWLDQSLVSSYEKKKRVRLVTVSRQFVCYRVHCSSAWVENAIKVEIDIIQGWSATFREIFCVQLGAVKWKCTTPTPQLYDKLLQFEPENFNCEGRERESWVKSWSFFLWLSCH